MGQAWWPRVTAYMKIGLSTIQIFIFDIFFLAKLFRGLCLFLFSSGAAEVQYESV
jgi:hypothetical protein